MKTLLHTLPISARATEPDTLVAINPLGVEGISATVPWPPANLRNS
jgi:hypothetical protein